jgi:hypothetical protein
MRPGPEYQYTHCIAHYWEKAEVDGL